LRAFCYVGKTKPRLGGGGKKDGARLSRVCKVRKTSSTKASSTWEASHEYGKRKLRVIGGPRLGGGRGKNGQDRANSK